MAGPTGAEPARDSGPKSNLLGACCFGRRFFGPSAGQDRRPGARGTGWLRRGVHHRVARPGLDAGAAGYRGPAHVRIPILVNAIFWSVPEQREQGNDRNGYSQQPKQDAAAHGTLSLLMEADNSAPAFTPDQQSSREQKVLHTTRRAKNWASHGWRRRPVPACVCSAAASASAVAGAEPRRTT